MNFMDWLRQVEKLLEQSFGWYKGDTRCIFQKVPHLFFNVYHAFTVDCLEAAENLELWRSYREQDMGEQSSSALSDDVGDGYN